nr:hypothetical protein [Tanacetum cinerariifolium]
CCECGNALDGIYCKVSIISNPKPCNQTMNDELPQTLPGFDPTCYFDKENSVPCVSKPNFVDESSNSFNPPPQPPIYSCEFYGSNAQYGHYCTPHAPFINPEPGYSQDFNFPSRTMLMEQMTTLTSMCEMVCKIFQKKQEEKRIEEKQAASAQYWKILACCDDDDDYNSTITPVLSTEETKNSLSMGDKHLDIILATESDEVIKSSVENLVPIPTKDHFEIVINSNDDISSSDDDSLYNENIEYVEASPHDFEVVSLEVVEIVILKVEEIEDDNLLEKLLNVHLLIANIEALKDNPTPSSKLLTSSSFTSSKSFLEETNTFHNSLPEFENFYFDLEEISSGSTTTHSYISLPDYEVFYFDDDHISSGSTTTHSDISLSEYDSFIFDLSKDQFPPADRIDFANEEFADELAHIISPPEYDCFYFWDLPDPGELISIFNFRIRENLSTTCVNLPIEDDHSLLLAYVVWIFLSYLTYPVVPPYLHPFGNEDTIFDPGITINHFYSFKPVLSHQYGAFKKFNTHRSHLNEWPMIINRKNIPILDVVLIPGNLKTLAKGFYPPSLNFLSFNWESFTSEYGISEDVHPELPGPEERIVDFPKDIDRFNLISAPNLSKVKAGLRPPAGHEVPLLTATASRVIDMEDQNVAKESSGTPFTVEKSLLDFDNENSSSPMTEGKGTEDQAHETVAPKILLPGNMPATGAALEVSLEEEVAALEPCLSKKRCRRVNDGADANAPPKVPRKDYASCNYTNKLHASLILNANLLRFRPKCGYHGSARHALCEKCRVREIDLLPIHGWITRRYLSARMGRDQQLPPGHPRRMLRCCRSYSAAEVRLLKKTIAQITRRDQMIQVKEEEIKKLDQEIQGLQNQTSNLKTLLEAEADMKKAAETKNADLTKELKSLCTQFLDLQEFTKYEDDRVEKRCGEMDARLDALSIDFDEELYPHMLTAITGRDRAWEGRSRFGSCGSAVKEEMLLEEAIAANVSRTEKKKRCRVVCRTHEIGSAHHARSDGVPVSVHTVAPQGFTILLADAATQTKTS